ncbi:hypothetical protein EG68_00671 [Paragonimus skrjabini miyazakii]|uniref:Uncharacterized protein n=1 Tax=Paragonimus skrjabini miyazakii TaxID=59628 RepID=A0A8S9Z958_9TREM|nr:hypothetical protein EG68_00671 [Paragonimus skrjabini miyazakii]
MAAEYRVEFRPSLRQPPVFHPNADFESWEFAVAIYLASVPERSAWAYSLSFLSGELDEKRAVGESICLAFSQHSRNPKPIPAQTDQLSRRVRSVGIASGSADAHNTVVITYRSVPEGVQLGSYSGEHQFPACPNL